LGRDLELVWSAPSTTDRDRKELFQLLLEDVLVLLSDDRTTAFVTMHWRGGATTELQVDMAYHVQPAKRTPEDTIDLLKRLTVHYPDDIIAGILNRQGRRTASGARFTANSVAGLRRYRGIPSYQPELCPSQEGELLPIAKAAKLLGIAASTLHRWLSDGFVPGEQLTPGAPWRIRMTDELHALFTDEAPPGWVGMLEATLALGVSRQTVLQRVKRGELRAIHLRSGRRKGLRIELPHAPNRPFGPLFDGVSDSPVNHRGSV
jgi:hypothetical protein